jgi:hypothetical protein
VPRGQRGFSLGFMVSVWQDVQITHKAKRNVLKVENRMLLPREGSRNTRLGFLANVHSDWETFGSD